MKNILIFLTGAMLLCTGCEKDDAPSDWQPSSGPITVELDKTSIKQNEFFTFTFAGYADYIAVYDGTLGHEYRYKDRTAMQGVKPKVSFSSFRRWGAQENSLAIKVSTDFAGINYDANEINQATWTDITSRFILSTGADNTPSGTVDLSDLVVPGKNMFFAFEYKGQAGTTQREWFIRNFVVKNELPTGVIQDVATTATAGWKSYSFLNDTKTWITSATELRIEGGNETSAQNHDWLITSALDFTKVEPDQPSHIIKTRFQNMLNKYQIGYAKPGVYTMTAVIEGSSQENSKVENYEVSILEN